MYEKGTTYEIFLQNKECTVIVLSPSGVPGVTVRARDMATLRRVVRGLRTHGARRRRAC